MMNIQVLVMTLNLFTCMRTCPIFLVSEYLVRPNHFLSAESLKNYIVMIQE